MLVGPVSIDGTLVVEGNSNLLVLSQITGSGGGTTIETGSFATTGSNTFEGSQTIQNGGQKTGAYYKTGSTEMFFGLDSNELLVISGSGRPNIIEINPSSGWIEFYSPVINFNNSVSLRGFTQIRNITTQVGDGYVAQFDNVVVSGSLVAIDDITLIGNQTITGSLFVSASASGSEQGVVFNVSSDGGPGTRNGVHINGRFSVNGPTDFENPLYLDSLFVDNVYSKSGGANPIRFRSNLFLAEPDVDVDVIASGSFDISGSVSIKQVLNLVSNDPLPSGNIGDLAVSGSNLFFYNGAWTQVV
jgi:hypothetical protein